MARLVKRNNEAGPGPLHLKQPSIILTMGSISFFFFDVNFIINDHISGNRSDSNLRHVAQRSYADHEHGLVSDDASVRVHSVSK